MLKALYWMKKDLYGNSISDYNDYMNPVLNRTYEIRNVMEHRYLKILSYANIVSEEYKIDKLATIISVEEFHDLAVNLLRTCREAIILLVMLINVEEKRKSTNSEGLIIPEDWNGNSFFDKFYKVQNFFPYAIPIVLDNEPPRM
ncbi:LA2681 family HEPN domain-containing protein [Enterococcus casseliflavus]